MSEYKSDSPYGSILNTLINSENAFDMTEDCIRIFKNEVTSERESFLNEPDRHMLCYVMDGMGIVNKNGKRSAAQSGDVIFISPLDFTKLAPMHTITLLYVNMSNRTLYRLLYNSAFFSDFSEYPKGIVRITPPPRFLLDELVLRSENCPNAPETQMIYTHFARALLMAYSRAAISSH